MVMKRMICFLLVVVMLAALFVGCGAKFTCDLCGEEKSGKKYEDTIFGEKITYCKECKEGLEELGNLLG